MRTYLFTEGDITEIEEHATTTPGPASPTPPKKRV